MAEALIVVGAIASAVQITDCVFRLSKALHGKYEAFGDAEENVIRLRRTLEDFELVAHNLRLYQVMLPYIIWLSLHKIPFFHLVTVGLTVCAGRTRIVNFCKSRT